MKKLIIFAALLLLLADLGFSANRFTKTENTLHVVNYQQIGNTGVITCPSMAEGDFCVTGTETIATLKPVDLTVSGNFKSGNAVDTDTIDLTEAQILGTNALVFEGGTVDGTELTLVIPNLAADYTLTVPTITANDTLCSLALGQTLSNKTLTTPVIASFYQDAGLTKLMTTPNTASDTLCAIAATQTLTNKTLTAPKFSDLGYVASTDGSTTLEFDSNAGQVNYFSMSSVPTGFYPGLSVKGSDSNIGMTITPKGTGSVQAVLAASGNFEVWTGNLKVGDGTPTVSLNGEDAYIEGTLEVGAAIKASSGITLGTSTLSVYEEGTFVPTVTAASGTDTVPQYITNTGRFTRIGRICYIDVLLTGDGGNEGSGTSTLSIALPYASSASHPIGSFYVGTGINNTATYPLIGSITGGASTIALQYFDAIATRADFSPALQDNATRTIRLKFSYEL